MNSKKREKRFKCDECSSAFTTASELKIHKSSIHSDLRPFRCEHCDYSAKFKWTLTQHYAKHFPQIYKTQSCPQCPYKCSKPADLQTHLRVHTKEKPFACKLCSYRASRPSSLAIHIRTHTGEKQFKCSLCTLTFSQLGHLKRHTLFVHNKKDVSLVACSFPGCDRKFTNTGSVRQHIESIHKKETRFSCPYCQKVFYRNYSCISHIRHRHTSERPYKCSVCEYVSVTSSYLKRHMSAIHADYIVVKCPICHKKYKNDRSLAKHHNLSHSEEPAPQWKCKEPGCTKKYKSRQGLNRHVNSFHLQQRPFKCLFCDHTTATSSMLNLHLKTHTQEKPYSCNKCNRCFISSSNLSAHKATAHSQLRPFQCDLCCYSAKTKACLKQHQKIHEPNRTDFSFECKICKESRSSKNRTNYFFRTKRGLSSHMRELHSNNGSFNCSLSPPGSKTKDVEISKTDPKCVKSFLTSGDCPPCFVRLVRKTELKGDPLCESTIPIYA